VLPRALDVLDEEPAPAEERPAGPQGGRPQAEALLAVGGDHPAEPCVRGVAGARAAQEPQRPRIGVDRGERIEVGLVQRPQDEPFGHELAGSSARVAHGWLQ